MKKLFSRIEFWVLLAVLAIGVALVATATVHTVQVGRKLAEYTHIQAVVTGKEIVPGSGNDHSTVATVIEFEVDGIAYTVKNRISSTGNSDKIGATVEIAYNPSNPNDCLFVKTEKNWCVLRFAVSGVFLLICVWFTAMLIKSVRRENRGKTL